LFQIFKNVATWSNPAVTEHSFFQEIYPSHKLTTLNREFKWETGRLVLVLNKLGRVSTKKFIREFYPRYNEVSLNQKLSLEICFSKLVQRARKKMNKYGINIIFNNEEKKWELEISNSQNFLT
jgi:hypothetical protein